MEDYLHGSITPRTRVLLQRNTLAPSRQRITAEKALVGPPRFLRACAVNCSGSPAHHVNQRIQTMNAVRNSSQVRAPDEADCEIRGLWDTASSSAILQPRAARALTAAQDFENRD